MSGLLVGISHDWFLWTIDSLSLTMTNHYWDSKPRDGAEQTPIIAAAGGITDD